jgi:rhodanese-related sulfurtransferase
VEGDIVAMKQNNSRTVILAGLIFLTLANMRSVTAQTLPATGLPEALKGIKPSVGLCTGKDAEKPKPSEFARVAEVKPDLSCGIAPEDVVRQLQSPNTVLIDARGAMDFASFHINEAMNISSTELRGKTFLRGKSLILIGNGKAEQQQYIDCRRLKSNGFKQVRVLRGGMPAWLAAGQSVLGQSPDPAQLTRLTPSELWIESRFESNLVLVAAGRKTLQKQIKGSVLIPDERPQTIQSAIDKRRRQSKSASLSAVVLAADKGTDLQTLSQTIKPVPLLVYSETAEAFARQLAQQDAVWEAQAKGPKQPPRCGG